MIFFFKIGSGSKFCGLTFDLILSLVPFLCYIPLPNSKSIKVTKILIDFQLRKWNLIFGFPSQIGNFLIDRVFSYCNNFIKKVSIINCFRNSKSFKPIFLKFES